jgi:hypothetical protein
MTVEPQSAHRPPGRRAPAALLIGIAVWLVLNALALLLAGGVLPFERPALASLPFVAQMSFPTVGLVEIAVLMAVVWLLTRRRAIPDVAARAPERAQAARETAQLLAWAAAGQAGGWLIGPALGIRPFSFHLAGMLVGCQIPPTPREALIWAGYNFVVFAVIPYLWFRRRYSPTELNLRSVAPGNDLLVILVVGAIETASELVAFPGVFNLTPHQAGLAMPLAFLLFGLGTVLPTMVLIYCILIPRYLKLTGSFTATVMLGGLTYAAMHIVEGWSNFSSPRDAALSLIFVLLTYVGPGMFKSFVTLRTGNAWIHAIAYHSIAPHVVVDAPLVAKIFTIR